MDIAKIDECLRVANALEEDGLYFYDVRTEPFALYGLYDPKSTAPFLRLSPKIAKQTSHNVAHLNYQTAGGRVRFSTDSQVLVLKAVMNRVSRFSHMPATGAAGFDLFIDIPENGSRFVKSFVPPFDATEGYSSKITFPDKRLRYITVNFPSYAGVTSLAFGLEKGAALGHGLPYRSEKPIVYYGSSITQGACSSRPGNTYQNIICRRMNIDYLNLGFSGSGKAEKPICEYMASLPMSAFISDYDHNAPDAAYLAETHKRLYETVRTKNPTLPFIMLSRPDFDSSYSDSIKRRDAIFETYRAARAGGDQNVYYIDGASVFRGPYEAMCTVDATHPNDLGMALMADAIEAELRRAFTQNEI